METKELYKYFLECSGVSTDTRAIESGNMFFALKGPNFNGNRFAEQAIQSGAKWAVIDEEDFQGENTILVKDVLSSLQALANHHRQTFNIPVFAITGSNGKTTSKELIRDVIKCKYRTHATVGNLNNHIGIPLTLLRMPRDTEFAIIEMGANAQGEIDAYCQYTEPTAGYITNIGKAHLEGFGGIEGVEKGKTELFRYLQKSGGTVFYRLEDPILSKHAQIGGNSVSFGQTEEADFIGKLLSEAPTLEMEFFTNQKAWKVDSNLAGGYNFHNLLSAAAIGLHYGVDPQKIQKALSSYKPENNRSQLVRFDDFKVILDAYNANPSSMELALENLSKYPEEKKIAILGQMNEVGPDSEKEHQSIVDFAIKKGIEEIILVGPNFKDIARGKNLPHFMTAEEAIEHFESKEKSGSIILIKGSRSNQLEKLIKT